MLSHGGYNSHATLMPYCINNTTLQIWLWCQTA